jgi:hypothetical protein
VVAETGNLDASFCAGLEDSVGSIDLKVAKLLYCKTKMVSAYLDGFAVNVNVEFVSEHLGRAEDYK